MPTAKADIIARLQRDILSLHPSRQQGKIPLEFGLPLMNDSFPSGTFPTGVVHEFICDQREDVSASAGFINGILCTLLRDNGAALWISAGRTLFPPALKAFGIQPDRIIFIDLRKEKDVLWAIEEALKCEGLAGVVGEIAELSFTASRRLQLAVEKSRCTGFIIRHQVKNLSTTACVTRWYIRSIPSENIDELPGVGFPCWQVELRKVRNGKPGTWKLEWINKKFHFLLPFIEEEQLQRKTG